MMNMVYLPHLNRARIIKAYRLESPRFGSHCGVLLTDCESPLSVQYAHVMVVNRGVFVFGQRASRSPPKSTNKHRPTANIRIFSACFPVCSAERCTKTWAHPTSGLI